MAESASPLGGHLTHVIVLAAGKVLAQGGFDAVRADEAVQAAYLGSAP